MGGISVPVPAPPAGDLDTRTLADSRFRAAKRLKLSSAHQQGISTPRHIFEKDQ